MNIQTLRMATMTAAMLDDCWLERIADEIDALPEMLDFCTPFDAGKLDAAEGLELDPTRHGLITVFQAEEYILGFRSVGELEMLIDGRDDEEFWRGGC